MVAKFLVQILLPVFDNKDSRIPQSQLRRVSDELLEKFGGVTAYTRAPAKGFWQDKGRVAKDEVIIVETMAPRRYLVWWRQYQKELEKRFRQEKIIIRVQRIEEVLNPGRRRLRSIRCFAPGGEALGIWSGAPTSSSAAPVFSAPSDFLPGLPPMLLIAAMRAALAIPKLVGALPDPIDVVLLSHCPPPSA